MTARDTIWSPGSRLRYMPQLDALRAIAVGLVVVYHFWRPARHQSLHFGSIGVRIFFVLSGFLITGILLEARRELDAGRTSPGTAVRRFYLRRVLRIFPVYYLVLAIAWAGNVVGAREGIAWHAAYLSNLYFFRENAVHPGRWGGRVAHFWSLAVEEQFYVVWPWVILFAPRRWLPRIALVMVAVGPIFRAVALGITGNDLASVLTPGCVDSLGLGAYLAMTIEPELAPTPGLYRIGAPAFWAGALLLLASLVTSSAGGGRLLRFAAYDLGVALVAVWLVAQASAGFGRAAGMVLEFAPLRYLGTISYGIYLYHLMLPDLALRVTGRLGHADLLQPLGDQTLPYLLFYSALTIAVAAVSWHCFEGPINRLKDRFDRGGEALRIRA
jgi:peptidoglycan/LPS O-acetylase OafA/YrhL